MISYRMKQLSFFLSLMFALGLSAQSDTTGFSHAVKIAADWKNVKSKGDSLFVIQHSDDAAALHFYSKETLPVFPGIDFSKSKKGEVIGPCHDGNTYRIYKNAGTVKSADSVQVSHILYAYKGAAAAHSELQRTKVQAKKSADSLCELIRNGSVLLEDVVEQVTDDPGSKGGNKGNYGWFTHESGFVEPFKQAGFANPVGATVVVETDFGYHIIQVEAKSKSQNYFQFWEIVRIIDTCYSQFGVPVVRKQAGYPGGNAGFLEYLQKEKLKYDSLSSPVYEGLTIIFGFTVEENGTISGVEMVFSPIPGTKAEQEFIQMIGNVKGWTPQETCTGVTRSYQMFGLQL